MTTKKTTPKETRYEISDDLVARAMIASGKKNPEAVIRLALEELIASRTTKPVTPPKKTTVKKKKS